MQIELTERDNEIITIKNYKSYCIDCGELFGDDIIEEYQRFDVCLFGVFYKNFDVRKIDTELKIIVKNSIINRLLSRRELLAKAFEIIEPSIPEYEFIDYLCEDDFLEGKKSDIRKLINEEETYQNGMDFWFIMKEFLIEHFDECFYKIVLEEKRYGVLDTKI